jgi:hypothetical protein
MKLGVFESAIVIVTGEPEEVTQRELFKVSLTIHPCDFVEIIHYGQGVKNPDNKRTILFNKARLVSFIAKGYANNEG